MSLFAARTRSQLPLGNAMGYYLRVLTKSGAVIPIRQLKQRLAVTGLKTVVDVDADDDAEWTEALLRHPSGEPIAHVERNPVRPGELGQEEIEEFAESVSGGRPESAAR